MASTNNAAHRRRVQELREVAAQRYRPDRVDLLLVAEAPPSADDRYFYFEDVQAHDWLFRGVAEVVLGQRPGRSEKATALAKLRNKGIFLIDLKLDPVDRSDLTLHVPDLVTRCAALEPRRIILIKATVFDAAYQTLSAAGLPVVNKRVFFPESGRQLEFKKQFVEALSL